MPQTPEHEERTIGEYVESQLRDDEDAVVLAEPPKGDDLKGWMAIFAGVLLPEQRQRAYLRDVTARCWDL